MFKKMKNKKLNLKKFEQRYFAKRDKLVLNILRASTVGVAGAGGLGSNVAFSLARAGVGKLVMADSDRLEPSNLNRQQYFVHQIGQKKVEALRDNLLMINPFSQYEIHFIRLTRKNIPELFSRCDLIVEAFDRAEAKEMLIETWLKHFPDRPVIAASGLAGFGKNNKLRTRRLGNLYICGDEASECPADISPMAPRVAIVANMQANLAVELLVKKGSRYV